MTKTLLIAAALGLTAYSCSGQKHGQANNTPENTLSKKEKAAGWKLLFDGKTTAGWHTYGTTAPGTAWQAADGTLHLDGNAREGRGDLISDEEYGNFELQLDWKISEKGNSGICLYVIDNKDKYKYMWYTGLEMQILDNDGHPDGKITKHRAGDLYDLIKSSSEPVKAVGEWNHVAIKSLNGKLDFYLNGVHIVDTHLWDDNWRNLVAGSKFKGLPDFTAFKSGHIGLQDHGNTVWFRNIKVRKL
ncbi:3-keto-disaccharide hydrolase [Niabella hirudinis]|uniref:3-keto-disaccharide hydrolase n=1 Tax=Niabella hirudinis TaxID=1285929 RepID=UPI003EB9C620